MGASACVRGHADTRHSMQNTTLPSRALFDVTIAAEALAGIQETLRRWPAEAKPPEPPLTPAAAYQLAVGACLYVRRVLEEGCNAANLNELLAVARLPNATGLHLVTLSREGLSSWVAAHCEPFARLVAALFGGESVVVHSVGDELALYLAAQEANYIMQALDADATTSTRSYERLARWSNDVMTLVVAKRVSPVVVTFLDLADPRAEMSDLELALVQPGSRLHPLKWALSGS